MSTAAITTAITPATASVFARGREVVGDGSGVEALSSISSNRSAISCSLCRGDTVPPGRQRLPRHRRMATSSELKFQL
ncbi:MAG: hypothetical protein U0165_08015 [Polyangiaceae bacterium]